MVEVPLLGDMLPPPLAGSKLQLMVAVELVSVAVNTIGAELALTVWFPGLTDSVGLGVCVQAATNNSTAHKALLCFICPPLTGLSRLTVA